MAKLEQLGCDVPLHQQAVLRTCALLSLTMAGDADAQQRQSDYGHAKGIMIADRHPILSRKLWRGLALALLMAAIGITFGGCCAATNTSATFGVATQSLARAELAVKSKTAYASLESNSTVKAKAVVAAPLVATADSAAVPLTAKEAWMEKLRQDIHESRLRLCNWNEEIKSRDRKFGAGEQEVTGSITTVPMVAGARDPCE